MIPFSIAWRRAVIDEYIANLGLIMVLLYTYTFPRLQTRCQTYNITAPPTAAAIPAMTTFCVILATSAELALVDTEPEPLAAAVSPDAGVA